MLGLHWFYGWVDPDSTPAPIDPGAEPDPFTCACAAKAPVGYLKPELEYCDWYSYRERTGKTQQPVPPQNSSDPIYAHDVAEYKAAAKHLRTALTMQAAGYKGSQHHRALAKAREERDCLIGV